MDLLYEAGHNVTVANRGSNPNLFSSDVKLVKVDRSDEKSMKERFEKAEFDVVYDQMCYVGDEAEIVKRVFQDRIGRLVLTSTASVYSTAANRPETFFEPSTMSADDSYDNSYQRGKRFAERSYSEAKFPTTAVRFPFVLGLDDYTRRLHWHIEHVAQQVPMYFPNIQAKCSFIRSDETANFLFWLLSKEELTGAVNACSPDPVSLFDLIKSIEKCVGRNAVFASTLNTDNKSPYGIESDSTLSVEKALSYGFKFLRASEWLPKLIQEIATQK